MNVDGILVVNERDYRTIIGQTTLQGEIKGEKEMKLLYSVKAYCVCVCGMCMWSNEIAWLTIYS